MRIQQIWCKNYGVVMPQLFHNVTSEEAFTIEALMLDAIGNFWVFQLNSLYLFNYQKTALGKFSY